MIAGEERSKMWKKPTKKVLSNCENHSCRRGDENYVKAAAWAWYLRGAGAHSKPVEEESTNPSINGSNKRRPSRFKLEALGLLRNNILDNKFTTLDTLTGRESDSANGFRDYLDFFSLECKSDVCGSSLVDSYDLVALSKQLENLVWSVTQHSVSSRKSPPKRSRMDHGISADECSDKRFRVRDRESLAMCRSAGKEIVKTEKNHHGRLHDLAKKLQLLGFGFSSAPHRIQDA